MRRLRGFSLLLLFLLATGCSTYAANRYSVDADNVVALRGYSDSKVAVGTFTASKPGQYSLNCRMVGPIQTPGKVPFSEYIRDALISELQMAEVYDSESSVVLTGHLADIKFSSTSGGWEISLNVASSNGSSFSVFTTYDYSSSLWGETACNQTAQALAPAVQDLIRTVVFHEQFPHLMAASAPGTR